jgi:hypothetical protein
MHENHFNTLVRKISGIIFLCILHSSCRVLQKTNKHEINDGYYTQHIDKKKQKVYIDVADDTIRIHQTQIRNNQLIIDTIAVPSFYEKEKTTEHKQATSFDKVSFDIDVFTIPLKLRPSQADVPAQLNTILNGAVYFGLREDKYILDYSANPLGKSDLHMNHFGFSIGVFSGLGNTFISPTNTNYILQQEYDGVVFSKGLAGIFAINNLTVGVAVGFDNLLDKNKSIWIYENNSWLGLAIGLNLN